MEEAGLMGVAGMVFVDARKVWSKEYGHRDYLRTQPFTTTTPMTVASITKTFTGVAMMRLVAEGKLDLDADVNRYVPFSVRNPRFPDTPITLRMIATHTSSITDRWEVYRATYSFGGDPAESLTDFITSYFARDGRRARRRADSSRARGRRDDPLPVRRPGISEGLRSGRGQHLFWRTRNNGAYIGHGGNDPGVQAAMLSSVDRRVAVVLLSNTSGGSVEFTAFDAIFRSLMAYGHSQIR